MATLLSELVGVLAGAAARDLRGRTEETPLSRAEMMALATVLGLAAADRSAAPTFEADDTSWEALQAEAAFDLAVVKRMELTKSKH